MIDASAPVQVVAETEIGVEIETVWRVLTDIDSWPEWNSDVKSASMDGVMREGTTFRWKVSGGTITSTFTDVVPPRLVGWTGHFSPLGVRAVHVWHLTPHHGSTFVRTEESWSGLLPRFLKGFAARLLSSSIDKGLDNLRAECERRHAGEP